MEYHRLTASGQAPKPLPKACQSHAHRLMAILLEKPLTNNTLGTKVRSFLTLEIRDSYAVRRKHWLKQRCACSRARRHFSTNTFRAAVGTAVRAVFPALLQMKGNMQPSRPITPQSSTNRDLVLTVLHRGDFDYIAPFVLSLKRSGFRGSTVVFTSNVDTTSVEQLRRWGASVVAFRFSGQGSRQHLSRPWPLWRWFFSTGAPRSAKIWLAHAVFHLTYRRHVLFLEFLEKHAADFDRILLADGKDVFFQADPFSWNWTAGVHFFLEEAGHRMGDDPYHREWFRRLFGPTYLEAHGQRVPACSGTTFGDAASIRQYLELMVTITMQALELGKLFGGDQAVHNYILIQKLMDNITLHENRHGPVLTMQVMKEADLQTDAQGAVINDDGTVVPVLHQYNYFPALQARLLSSLQTVDRIAVCDAVPLAVQAGNEGRAATPAETQPSPA